MKTISEHIMEWAKKNSIHINVRDDNYLLDVNGNKANFPVLICGIEDENLLIVSCLLNIKADIKRADSISRAILRINYGLKYGSFHYNEDAGEVTYRLSQLIVQDDIIRGKQIEETIMRGVMATDEYYEKMTLILLGEGKFLGDNSD